jgi:hypothetical protein
MGDLPWNSMSFDRVEIKTAKQSGKAREFTVRNNSCLVKNQAITNCRKRARERLHSIKDKGKLGESGKLEAGLQLQTGPRSCHIREIKP